MGVPDWGRVATARPRQKSGAWTKKKLRRQRAAVEAAKGGRVPPELRRVERVVRLPHEL